MNCPKCGAPLVQNAQYCISCGSAVEPPKSSAPASQEASGRPARPSTTLAPDERRRELFPLLASAAIALIGLIAFAFVLWPDSGEYERIGSGPRSASAPAPPPPPAARAPDDPRPISETPPRAEITPPAPAPEAEAVSRSESMPAKAAPAAAAQTARSATGPLTEGRVNDMVEAAANGDHARRQQLATQLASERPDRGDRTRARELNRKALALSSRGRFADAVPLFEAAREADGGDAEIRENLGYALLKAGRLPEAESALISALEVGPRRASAWGSLAFVYAKRGLHREAVGLIATAYQLAPDRKKAMETYTRQAQTEADPKVRAMLAEAVTRLGEAR